MQVAYIIGDMRGSFRGTKKVSSSLELLPFLYIYLNLFGTQRRLFLFNIWCRNSNEIPTGNSGLKANTEINSIKVVVFLSLEWNFLLVISLQFQ